MSAIMNRKDPLGFNKAINWDKLNDPEILKQLEKIFNKKHQATSSPQSDGKKNYEKKDK